MIVYFEEAIRQKEDYLSMYNLAHILIYDETIKRDINKSIELLIKSSNKFQYSFNLLCIALIKQFGFNIEIIKQEILKIKNVTEDILAEINHHIASISLIGELNFEILYESYRNKDFVYNFLLVPIFSYDLEHKRICFIYISYCERYYIRIL